MKRAPVLNWRWYRCLVSRARERGSITPVRFHFAEISKTVANVHGNIVRDPVSQANTDIPGKVGLRF